MALTISSQIFGMMASALNNSKQPEIIKWFCRLPVCDARQNNKTL